ncbi:MAG TPA: MATE family efflux transporter [Steroidobacteraceae bacterium]|jgi:MATE family multidrug resistance protein|nr:MATE family efflux transporter [Steroidobacteraceae bacterium]
MDVASSSSLASGRGVPARRIDPDGRAHVDFRAVLALALPLMANSAVQVILNLTDMWFVGHISTAALAAVGAVQWMILAVVLLLGGASMAVQTLAAHAHGARRYRRAAQAAWTALWLTICAVPIFIGLGAAGRDILAPFGFTPRIADLAQEFWYPRVGGACFGVAAMAMIGFFNGIGRPRVSFVVAIAAAIANAVFNYIFIFRLGWGVAGSAWASNVAQAVAFAIAFILFLRVPFRESHKSHLGWRPRARLIREQLFLGLPMGMMPAADVLGFSVFQMMEVRYGTISGAATQMVSVLTSIAYMPGIGIATAATTLVGQSIGAGDREWAMRLGTRVILLTAVVMGGIGFALAVTGPWLLPLFAGARDRGATAAADLGVHLLWLAAAYQFFDGLNLGSSMCLRGAGDVRVPVLLVFPVCWLVFVPLAHILTFAPGQGWFHFLPAHWQLGYGAAGGWTAVVIYVVLLGCTLFLRWRSRAWQRIRL